MRDEVDSETDEVGHGCKSVGVYGGEKAGVG